MRYCILEFRRKVGGYLFTVDGLWMLSLLDNVAL